MGEFAAFSKISSILHVSCSVFFLRRNIFVSHFAWFGTVTRKFLVCVPDDALQTELNCNE